MGVPLSDTLLKTAATNPPILIGPPLPSPDEQTPGIGVETAVDPASVIAADPTPWARRSGQPHP